MKNLRQILAIVSVALLLGVTVVNAEIPENERILVTDPDLLEQMGFDPGDTVYMYTGGTYHGEFADFMASQGVETPAALEDDDPNFTSFGTGTAYWPVSGRQFEERRPGFDKGTRGHDDITRTGLSESFVDAQLYIPSGADLNFVRTWGFDSNILFNIVVSVIQFCLPDFAAGTSSVTILVTSSSATTLGTFSILGSIPGNLRIDNQSCTYMVRARFDAIGSSLALNKVRAQYRRQISPIPPGPASFPDIVGHPQRQAIEALAASGITGGFPDGTFRPNIGLTRAQMAAFLARALGLHWASF